jgi:hypothetical protein
LKVDLCRRDEEQRRERAINIDRRAIN